MHVSKKKSMIYKNIITLSVTSCIMGIKITKHVSINNGNNLYNYNTLAA